MFDRWLLDSNPNNSELNDWDNRLVVDGANGVGGQKLELLKEKLNGLAIEIRNSGKGEGVLNERVGADFVQKEKIVPCNFGSQDVGIRFVIAILLIIGACCYDKFYDDFAYTYTSYHLRNILIFICIEIIFDFVNKGLVNMTSFEVIGR